MLAVKKLQWTYLQDKAATLSNANDEWDLKLSICLTDIEKQKEV